MTKEEIREKMDKNIGKMVFAGACMIAFFIGALLYAAESKENPGMFIILFMISGLSAMYLFYKKNKNETLRLDLFDAIKNEADNKSDKKSA